MGFKHLRMRFLSAIASESPVQLDNTGDLVPYLPDRTLEILGRVDFHRTYATATGDRQADLC
jgi:hypothetical protein